MLELLIFSINPFVIGFYIFLFLLMLKGCLVPKLFFTIIGLSFLILFTINVTKIICFPLVPPLHKSIFFELEGIKDNEFKKEFGKRIGYEFKNPHKFTIKIECTSTVVKSHNKEISRMEYNSSAGVLTVEIKDVGCGSIVEIPLPATNEVGLKMTEIEEIHNARMLYVVRKNMSMIACRIRKCMDKVIK